MTPPQYLTRHLLIAMPTLEDPFFARAVTLICQHGEEGAMGLTINRPSELCLGDLMRQIGFDNVPPEVATRKVLIGGPVQMDRGFVLHEGPGSWDSSHPLGDDLMVTTSRDVLEAIAAGRGPTRYLVMLGYAGWIAGQLERELRDNAWLTVIPRDHGIFFETPLAQRWDAAARMLGIDITHLTGTAGHA